MTNNDLMCALSLCGLAIIAVYVVGHWWATIGQYILPPRTCVGRWRFRRAVRNWCWVVRTHRLLTTEIRQLQAQHAAPASTKLGRLLIEGVLAHYVLEYRHLDNLISERIRLRYLHVTRKLRIKERS